MSLAENILKTLSVEEQKSIDKALSLTKQTQALALLSLLSKFNDPDTIEIRFKKSFPKGNINVVKTQLGQLLLDQIYTQNKEDYAFAQVNELLLQIHVFIKKSAFDIVKKLLDKAFIIAEENELFSSIADLLDIKLTLLNAGVLDTHEEIKKTILENWKKKNNHIEYQLLLSAQNKLIAQNFTIKTEELQTAHAQIIQNPLLNSQAEALSIKALLDFWIIKGQYFSVTNNYAEAAKCFEGFIHVLDKNPALKRQRNLNYLSLCAQLVTYGYILKNEAMMQAAIANLENATKYNEIEEIAAQTLLVNANMAYFDFSKNKNGLQKTIIEAHELLKQYAAKLKPDVRSAIMLSCISGYAEFGLYEKLLEAIREFAAFIQSEARIDSKVAIYFYELIAQIETGNELMVNETLQNFNRFLLRHEFKGEFEQIMIKFLKIASAGSFKSKDELQLLKLQLVELPQKSLQNQNRVLYQILTNMVESKMVGKKFHEYLATIES